MHSLALLASLVNPLNEVIKFSLVLGVGINGWLMVRHLLSQIDVIKYSEALGWQITVANDSVFIDIMPSTVITAYAVFLHFKTCTHTSSWRAGHTQSRLVLYDALNADDYRRFIVKLKTSSIK